MIRTIWPLTVAAIALGIDAYVVAGILPEIASSLSTTVAVIGLGVTAFTGAYALAGPILSGRLTRGNTARAILIAIALFNLGNLVTSLSRNVEVFLASRALAGIGAGVLTAVATATAAAMVHSHQRGRAMSMVTFGLSLGTVAGVPLGMLIGKHVNWRWTMGLVVFIGVLSMIALALRARSLPDLDSRSRPSILKTLSSGKTVIGILGAFLLGIASLGLYTYMLPMAEANSLTHWGFGLIWAWGIGGVTGAAVIGRPLDRFGPKPFLIALPALLALSFAAIWLFDSPVVWLASATVWGAAGWSSVPTLQQALTMDRPKQAMTIIALQMAAMYLGSSVGAALGTALLTADVQVSDLPGWALIPVGTGLGLTLVIALGLLRKPGAVTESRTQDSNSEERQTELV